jgi:hypothetical protein
MSFSVNAYRAPTAIFCVGTSGTSRTNAAGSSNRFQSFNRFAPFQLSKAGPGSRVQGSKVQEFNRCAPFKRFLSDRVSIVPILSLPNRGSEVQGPALSLSKVQRVQSQIRAGNFHTEGIFEVGNVRPSASELCKVHSEAYASDFASENDTPTLENTVSWQGDAETAET